MVDSIKIDGNYEKIKRVAGTRLAWRAPCEDLSLGITLSSECVQNAECEILLLQQIYVRSDLVQEQAFKSLYPTSINWNYHLFAGNFNYQRTLQKYMLCPHIISLGS